MLNIKLNLTRFASRVSYVFWRLKKLVIKPKEEPTCEHCGGFLKYHAWSDCSGLRAMPHAMSQPPSAKVKAFYNSIGHKADEVGSKMCPCDCGKPLSTDHLRGVKYVHLENGDPALVNIECAEKFAHGTQKTELDLFHGADRFGGPRGGGGAGCSD